MHTVTPETINVIHKYLSAIYSINIHHIPKPIGGIIGVWDAYPIGGAWPSIKYLTFFLRLLI
jgi:hypothetical protein